jgi:phosphoglycerate dehydrogenase-like enzyme
MPAKTNIFIHDCIDPPRLEKLRALPDTRIDVIECDDEDEDWHLPDDRAAETHLLVSCAAPDNLDAMTSLRMLQISSVGFGQLIGLGLAERGILACNASGVFDVPIAEWNIAMMINLVRDVPGMVRNQQSQSFDRDARFQNELSGRIAGMWGYGGIGRETARLAKALNLTVYAMTRDGVKPRTDVYCVPGHGDPEGTLPDEVFVPGQEREFLEQLDFLIMAIPLSPATEGLVGDEFLQMLPSRAYVLNPARGPLIREESLLRALRENWIAGAALDTHYYYPLPPEHPLWHFPNVIITPHVSGSNLSPHFQTRLWDIIVDNSRRFIAGEPLMNQLTARQLAG